jgi:hypothetical protein
VKVSKHSIFKRLSTKRKEILMKWATYSYHTQISDFIKCTIIIFCKPKIFPKICSQNAGNAIWETSISKFFRGGELSPAPLEGLCPQYTLHLEAAMKWAGLNFSWPLQHTTVQFM